MSNIYFSFASLYFTFNRPNELRESNKDGIHLSHGRASERYNGSISSTTSRTNLHCQCSFKTIRGSEWGRGGEGGGKGSTCRLSVKIFDLCGLSVNSS